MSGFSTDVYQYNALSDGVKRVYTNKDELSQYGNRGILDPNDVSFFSLFINGVLQPKVNYEIQKGILILRTEDMPVKDSAIIISFITFEEKTSKVMRLSSALVEGTLPCGVVCSGPATDIDICVQENEKNFLCLENNLLCGPPCIPSGCKGAWEFSLTISNISQLRIRNIVIKDTILLDLITNIENISVSCGSLLIKDEIIIWDIDELGLGESATADFRVEGFFQVEGTRYIDRSRAYGRTVLGSVSTDISSLSLIKVSRGLELSQTIISGPTKVKANNTNTWRIEIKIANFSINTISDVQVRDSLFIDSIRYIKIVSISQGTVALTGNEILWQISALRECENSVLVIDVIGCFCQNGVRIPGAALGIGRVNAERIFSNSAEDFPILVSSKRNGEKKKILLNAQVLSKPLKIFADHPKKWAFSLMVTNTDNRRMRNLIVLDYILLDKFQNITIKYITTGKILVSDNAILWKIKELLPGETLTAVIEVEGLFNTAGYRPLSRALAGIGTNPCILSNITSGSLIHVLCPWESGPCKTSHNCSVQKDLFVCGKAMDIRKNHGFPDPSNGLTVEQYIVSGPLEVIPDQINTWKVEIRVANHGYSPLSNVIMKNALLLDGAARFIPIHYTKGTLSQEEDQIFWNIGTLNSKTTVVLLGEITGSFYKKNNKILHASNYQYNALANGIKKEFTNKDELTIYGSCGIPDPNEVSYFNLFINGVLQPETNYSVAAGLLTLTVSEPPEKDVPIILEYLIIKGDENQLVKAETYQYNTLSNGGKTYTDADELTAYGDQGIRDPRQSSYYNLFVNGMIQPNANYIIEPGILTLTVASAPMEGAPILVKFFSLYL